MHFADAACGRRRKAWTLLEPAQAAQRIILSCTGCKMNATNVWPSLDAQAVLQPPGCLHRSSQPGEDAIASCHLCQAAMLNLGALWSSCCSTNSCCSTLPRITGNRACNCSKMNWKHCDVSSRTTTQNVPSLHIHTHSLPLRLLQLTHCRSGEAQHLQSQALFTKDL